MKNTLLRFGSVAVPVLFVALIIAFVVLLRTAGPDDQLPDAVVPFLVATAILMFFAVIGLWFFIIFDMIHVARSHTFSGGQKAAWICAIWFLNIFVIPIYGLKFFRRLKETEHPTARTVPLPRGGSTSG